MSVKKKHSDIDREKKIKNIRKKNVLDKHKNLIYNIASSKSQEDEEEGDLNYAYVADTKIKRR